jgi:hypothetical protein
MTTITATTVPAATHARVSWRSGLTTAAIAAVVTPALATVFTVADAPLGVHGEAIPILAFVQMVLLGSLIGIVLARHSRRTTFLRVTVALTALSCVPSVALGTGAVDKLGLVLTHLVAAAIVIPRLARATDPDPSSVSAGGPAAPRP